ANGGTTAFSTATDVVDVTVTAVNDAPVLADTVLSMTAVQNAAAPVGAVGSLVSSFVGGITDVDAGALKGIAVTATDETKGVWSYSLNNGTTWIAVGAVDSANSLLLPSDATARPHLRPDA